MAIEASMYDVANDVSKPKVNKDVLVSDLKKVVADAEQLVGEVTRSSAEGLSSARSRIEEKLRDARSTLDLAREKTRQAGNAAYGYVSDNPWKAIASALVAGLLFGVIVSRR